MPMRLFPLGTGSSSRDIAVDLGTANTVLAARGGEFVVSEPSLVAVDAHTGASLAAGSEALELVGRDGIAALRPLKDGLIVDLQGTVELLRHLIGRMRRSMSARPRVIASVPAGVSGVQRRAVAEACVAAGAREARLVAATIAAALGSGLPVQEPSGSMVLDIGAGRSEVAMISTGGIVASRLILGGGHEFDRRIVTHLKRTHAVLIGERTAEQIKLQLSSTSPSGQDAQIEVLGRDIASEMLTSVRLTSQEIRGVLERPLTRIVEATTETLTRTPPQLACDVIDRGITLTGGSSLLHGLAERLRLEIGTDVCVADSPSTRIAVGLARIVEKHHEEGCACWAA
jgi:rod shape-determining protein MreB and related proteins